MKEWYIFFFCSIKSFTAIVVISEGTCKLQITFTSYTECHSAAGPPSSSLGWSHVHCAAIQLSESRTVQKQWTNIILLQGKLSCSINLLHFALNEAPQPHADAASGLMVTAKDDRISSSVKSTVAPLIKPSEMSSTTSLDPSLSKILVVESKIVEKTGASTSFYAQP